MQRGFRNAGPAGAHRAERKGLRWQWRSPHASTRASCRKVAVGFPSGAASAAPSYLSDSKRARCCLVTAGTREGEASLAGSVRNRVTLNSQEQVRFFVWAFPGWLGVQHSSPLSPTWVKKRRLTWSHVGPADKAIVDVASGGWSEPLTSHPTTLQQRQHVAQHAPAAVFHRPLSLVHVFLSTLWFSLGFVSLTSFRFPTPWRQMNGGGGGGWGEGAAMERAGWGEERALSS